MQNLLIFKIKRNYYDYTSSLNRSKLPNMDWIKEVIVDIRSNQQTKSWDQCFRTAKGCEKMLNRL